ncbi:MAG TPA: Ig-like domain-containing protein, partial [Gemmatimonadales bacterium]|nr:Ig-like domain-containing protein [Gemmatimonadales bacterium]
MPFTFKLSVRLALMKSPLAALAAAALVACEMPGRRVTDPNPPNNSVVQLITAPDTAIIDPLQSRQFLAFGRNAAGDSLAVAVGWSATGGAISSGGLYTAGSSSGVYGVIAIQSGGTLADTARVTVTSVPAPPGSVTNLAVASVTQSSVTLSFTEVSDGAGQPASYDVRYAVGTISWGAAASVTQGSCATPLAGTAIGAARSCTVQGLQPNTVYEFQLIAFRGTMNQNAVYGAVSNVAPATTTASTAAVATVTVNPATATLVIGGTRQLTATLRDAAGTVLTGRLISWMSDNPLVAAVNSTGLVSGVAVGATTITATSEGKSDTAAVTVTAPESGGTILLQEDFEATGFGGRGWYDFRVDPSLTDTTHAAGSARALEARFAAGATTPPWVAARHLFPSSPTVYVSYWVRYSANWVGSRHL